MNIAMTAPVITTAEKTPGRKAMHFIMPSALSIACFLHFFIFFFL
jgi:hypothetical protein